jgi:hypothetical protein
MTDLSALLERVEKAEGPRYELDQAINRAVDSWQPAVPPPYTASLDAALALVERVLPGHRSIVERAHDGTGWAMIQTGPEEPRNMTDAPTPALALISALLKALASKGVES